MQIQNYQSNNKNKLMVFSIDKIWLIFGFSNNVIITTLFYLSTYIFVNKDKTYCLYISVFFFFMLYYS